MGVLYPFFLGHEDVELWLVDEALHTKSKGAKQGLRLGPFRKVIEGEWG